MTKKIQNLLKYSKVAAVLSATTLTFGGYIVTPEAHALSLSSNASIDCTAGTFTGTVDCRGPFSGNDSNQIDENTELFGLTGWKELTKINTEDNVNSYSDDFINFSGSGGKLKNNISWSFNNNFDLSSVSELFFSVKGGRSFSTYLWDEETTSGTFDTQGIVKGNWTWHTIQTQAGRKLHWR